jgi:hypothetical protein
MYLYEALEAHDVPESKRVKLNEIEQHIIRSNWEPVLKSYLPNGTEILPAVWDAITKLAVLKSRN